MGLYQTLPALMPVVISANSQVVITDIDGDKISEVIVLNADIGQLAVVHWFNFAQLSSGDWATDTTTHWWNQWTTPPQGTLAGGWTVQGGDQMLAGDFDGDGVDELFLYNTTTRECCLVKWQNNALEVFNLGTEVYNWAMEAGDQFYVWPKLNGQAMDGLLAFNETYLTIGVFCYDTDDKHLYCKTVVFWGTVDNWNLHTGTQFVAGYLTDPGRGTFVLLDPSTSFIACLDWDGNEFTVSNGQNGTLGSVQGGNATWKIQSTDQMQCADLNGDGCDEVFLYNVDDGYIGAWQWTSSPSQFKCLAATKNVAGFSIGKGDQYLPLLQSGQTSVNVVAYSPSPQPSAGLLSYANGDFSFAPGNLGGGWKMSAADTYYCVAPPSVSQPQLFVVSPQLDPYSDNSIQTLGAITIGASGWAISSSVALPVLGWTPSLLVQAPPKTFTLFTDVEGDIYTYISNQFTRLYGKQTEGDIRSQYPNSEWASLFVDFVSYLGGQSHPPTDQNWTQEEWGPVQSAILQECISVGIVYDAYNTTIPQLAERVEEQQKTDLKKVKDNIQITTPPETAEQYWPSQLAVAVIWGFAAAAGGPIGIFASVAASLLGSLLSEPHPPPVPYASIKKMIEATYRSLESANTSQRAAILSDAAMLRIFNELSGTTWKMSVDDWPAQLDGFETADRIQFYQRLMPYVFTVCEVTGVDTPIPFYNLDVGHQIERMSFGSNFYISLSPGNGVYNDFVLCCYPSQGLYSPPVSPVPPSVELQTDLTNLGVKQNLLLGYGSWSNIPRRPLPGGN